MSAARSQVDELRSAMEQATGRTAIVSNRGRYVRVSVPLPTDAPTFQALLKVVMTADAWGSSDGTGKVYMWGALLVERAQS